MGQRFEQPVLYHESIAPAIIAKVYEKAHHEDTKDTKVEFDSLSRQVIGLAIEVHRELGPGLLESAYEKCLAHELERNGVDFVSQMEIPVRYIRNRPRMWIQGGFNRGWQVDR